MGVVFAIFGSAALAGAVFTLNYYNDFNINEQKKEAHRIVENELDKSLKVLFKETYPHIDDEELKLLMKEEKDTNFIRKTLNISLKYKEGN